MKLFLWGDFENYNNSSVDILACWSRLTYNPKSVSEWVRSWPGHIQKFVNKLSIQRPSRVCFCSLRNHTSVVLYLSYATKNTEKQLLILELIPHAKFAMMSWWRYADVATTSRRPVQKYTWRHWDSAMTLTQQRKSIYHICCIWYFYTPRIPRLNRRTPRVKLVFYEIVSCWW
jgi:hypothetical protein